MEKIKLYDIKGNDYPSNRGDSFRSLQVFECKICGALHNSVIMGGWPGYGIRIICPNHSEYWHKNLKNKVEWLDAKPHPKAYQDELQKEIDEAREKHKKDIKNDIQGNLDKIANFNDKYAVRIRNLIKGGDFDVRKNCES